MLMKTKLLTIGALCFVAAAATLIFMPIGSASLRSGPDRDPPQTWDAFGGNQQAQKYSTATQITPDNVKNLKQAWSTHTGDVSRSRI